ncbi:methyltransferase [bacterium]|nr:methyltransferase [bacterium]
MESAENFSKDEWLKLELLRERFLAAQPESHSYWGSLQDLELYDRSFARRISWKIEAVVDELIRLQALPDEFELVDFACGSGAMAETFAKSFSDRIKSITLYDHSSLAMEFSKAKLRRLHPQLSVDSIEKVSSVRPNSFIVASHVVGELSEESLRTFTQLLRGSAGFVLIEAGTPVHSAKLVQLRETLRRDGFSISAPCPHQDKCPMLNSDKDWCHNFAAVPSEVFQTPFWAEFSKRLKIDLRVLPYSYLSMSKASSPQPVESRQVGRARVYKGFVRSLWCDQSGQLEELEHSKKANAKLYKSLKKNPNQVFPE